MAIGELHGPIGADALIAPSPYAAGILAGASTGCNALGIWGTTPAV